MIEEKLEKLKKFYKKKRAYNIIEIRFINYMKSNLYIRIDYYPKDLIYKLTWLDLNYGDVDSITRFVSTEIMNRESVDYIISLLETTVLPNFPVNKNNKDDIVIIKSNVRSIIPNANVFEFYRYLPTEWSILANILVIVSKNLPSKLDEFFVQMLSSLTGEQYKYDYLNTIKFNITRGNINRIFDPVVIERAKNLTSDNIEFLEKIDNNYYAVCDDKFEYVVIIKEEEKNKVKLHCSCGCEYYCEHIYIVLKTIQEKKEKIFYKVVYNEPNKDLIDRMTNGDYILCLGTFDDKLKLLNNIGQIGLLPILDENGECNWTIIEDIDNHLQNEIEKIINK